MNYQDFMHIKKLGHKYEYQEKNTYIWQGYVSRNDKLKWMIILINENHKTIKILEEK